MRIALAAWEIGHASSGLGAKVGGLGVIVEELPPALVDAGKSMALDAEVVVLSPCFGCYDRSKLTKLPQTCTAVIGGNEDRFELYEHTFDDGQRVVYFWNDRWLGLWGPTTQVYPPEIVALRTYSAVCQAMAEYLNDAEFQTLHLHDYHVGLIPFYLNRQAAVKLPFHLTIHNASYQGAFRSADPISTLTDVNLAAKLHTRYFQFFDSLNLMRAAMIRTHETGGKVTTVSGDLDATWGYAREISEPESELIDKVRNVHPRLRHRTADEIRRRVYLPAQGLKEFQEIPVVGITNGIGDDNKAERLPWLNAETLRQSGTEFRQPNVQKAMTSADHNFSAEDLSNKQELKRLLHLEAFGSELKADTVLVVVVGRMVEQKGLHLVASNIARVRKGFPNAKFIVLGSAPPGDQIGENAVGAFTQAAQNDPKGVCFRNGFDLAFSKLMLAGGDFTFIPSRFEPCGIVDYEAVLLGTIVIGRLTGGLAKVRDFSFMYDWYDTSDEPGELDALYAKTAEALTTYRDKPDEILHMRKAGMTIDGSWHRSATQYLRMYQYGILVSENEQRLRQASSEFLKTRGGEDVEALRLFLNAGTGQQTNLASQRLLDQLPRQ